MEDLPVKMKLVTLPIFGGIQIGESALVGAGVTLALLIFAIFVSVRAKKFTEIPGKFQSAMEMLVGWLDNIAREKLHNYGAEMVPYCLAVGAYIIGSCLVELLGVAPPTADLSMTLALGIASFFMINFMGFKHLGFFGRFKAIGKPFAALAPIKIMTDLAVPISLSCRLYGNILAGYIIMEMIYRVVPIAIPAALSSFFTLFHMAIQAYVFITLSLSFTGELFD